MPAAPHFTSKPSNLANRGQISRPDDCIHRYHRLFENAPLVAYSLDSQLQTLYISPYCHKVFGYTDGEIQQDHLFWDQHIHPDDRQKVCRRRAQHLKGGESFTLEYRAIHRDSSVRHIINHTIPVSVNNKPHCIDGFIFDITARKDLEEQLVFAEKIKVLNDMSLSVAHEIRNPLTSIGGFARLLERRMAPDDPNRTHLDIIVKEVARLEETLSRVLNNFKPIRLHPVPSDINEIITKVLNQLNHEFHHTGIQLTTNLNGSLPQLEVDRQLIEEGFRSIMKAALRNTHDNGELTITSSQDQLQVIIEIDGFNLQSDLPGDSQLIFPFYREPVFDRGFGFPLSQQIISEHGGNMVFKNGCGQQAALVIALPINSRITKP